MPITEKLGSQPITKFRPEVQTLINSNPAKYDPNGNGVIDEGPEIGLLLQEYSCRSTYPLLSEYTYRDSMNNTPTRRTDYVQHTIDEDIEIDKRVEKELSKWKDDHPYLRFFTFGIATNMKESELREKAFRDIKSEQLKKGQELKNVQDQLKKKKDELDAREQSLTDREAKLNTKVANTAREVEHRVNSANQKAKTLNNQLDGMVKKTETAAE